MTSDMPDGICIRVPLANVMSFKPGNSLKRFLSRRRNSPASPFGTYEYHEELKVWLKERNSEPHFQTYHGMDHVDVIFPHNQHDTALLFKLTFGGE